MARDALYGGMTPCRPKLTDEHCTVLPDFSHTPDEGFGEWVGIFHGHSADFAIRYTTNERFEPGLLSLRAVERHSTIVHGSAGNETLIPCSSDVFVFVTL
jgi:hypothetical protein